MELLLAAAKQQAIHAELKQYFHFFKIREAFIFREEGREWEGSKVE